MRIRATGEADGARLTTTESRRIDQKYFEFDAIIF